MNAPYETLFAGYEDHWLYRNFMSKDREEPFWDGLLNDPRLAGLSSGEKCLLDVACSIKGPWTVLDDACKVRIAQAVLLTCQQQTLFGAQA